VQGLVRRRDRFWSVALFLANRQTKPKKLQDTAWLFQPELVVASPDGAPIFHSHRHQKGPGKADPVTVAEEQEMAMLYRHHVEFGVEHWVSLRADYPEGDCEKAHRLSTVVVPAYEILRTTPPTTADWPKLSIRLVVESPHRIEGQKAYSTLAALGPTVAGRCGVYLWPIEGGFKGGTGKPGLLHVKCAVADGRWLCLSSANLTEYAFSINMELGVLITCGTTPVQVETHFRRMIDSGTLVGAQTA
jgi:hypothetical protein